MNPVPVTQSWLEAGILQYLFFVFLVFFGEKVFEDQFNFFKDLENNGNQVIGGFISVPYCEPMFMSSCLLRPIASHNLYTLMK